MYTIEHSGCIWTPIGWGDHRPIWPIEELLARRKFTPGVQARIRRLNPRGKEEGELCRGWFRKPLSWRCAKRLMLAGKRPQPFRQRGGKSIWGLDRDDHPMLLKVQGIY